MNNTQLQMFEVSKLAINRKENILGKLIAENAKDLSNETIDRIFKPTCLPTKLIAICKELRDFGVITINDLEQ